MVSEKCLFADLYYFGLLAGMIGGEIDVTASGIAVESLFDSPIYDLTIQEVDGVITVTRTNANS
jgi:hypothetical protein